MIARLPSGSLPQCPPHRSSPTAVLWPVLFPSHASDITPCPMQRGLPSSAIPVISARSDPAPGTSSIPRLLSAELSLFLLSTARAWNGHPEMLRNFPQECPTLRGVDAVRLTSQPPRSPDAGVLTFPIPPSLDGLWLIHLSVHCLADE